MPWPGTASVVISPVTLYKPGIVPWAGLLHINDVYVTYMRHTEPHEFVESHNSQTIRQNGNKRFIY